MKESHPTALIVFTCLIMTITLFSGKMEKRDNVNASKQSAAGSNIMEVSDAEFNEIVMLVLAEAANQPHEGKVAVAATVLNRFKENFENSIHEVIWAEGQFSCCYNGYFCNDISKPLTFSDFNEDVKKDAMRAVEEALEGEDPTSEVLGGGCLFFYNPRTITPEQAKLRENIKVKYQIGDHIFYRIWDN